MKNYLHARRPIRLLSIRERIFLLLLTTVPALGIIAVISYTRWSDIRGTFFISTNSFNTTSGLIIESIVYTEEHKSGLSYYYSITYTFSVEEKQYTSDQITFGPTGFDTPEQAISFANKYPVGTTVTVYYLADEPTFAVLEPEVKENGFIFLVCMLAFFPLIMMLIITLNASQSRKSKPSGN